MSFRSIKREVNTTTTPWTPGIFDLPKDKDGVIYVRQSSELQQKNNIHSFEMQTEKFLEHFRNMGCTGSITIIADDEAMSGTLDMHERPGAARMMLLIKEHQQGKNNLGWVAAVHINRFFRDQWMINPDLFIKACYESDIVVATLTMTFNFRDPSGYSQRIFRIEAEEAARHLEWMKLVLGGGRSAASDKGYYDGRHLVVGYIVDRTDPKRKKYIIYEPHARVVRWLFVRFFELDGNFPQLCREIEKMPYLFPPFEPDIDTRGVKRRKRKAPQPLQGYTPSEDGLKGILTNPCYLGWWIPIDGGVVKNNHDPIIDEEHEYLFWYAFNGLSTHDLNGERQKPLRVIRNGNVPALLKKVIVAPNGQPIYAVGDNGGVYRHREYKTLGKEYVFILPIHVLDSIFLEKFMQRLASWQEYEDWEDKIEGQLQQRNERAHFIKRAIQDATEKMERIKELLADVENPLPKSLKAGYIKDYEGLEAKKIELEHELTAEAEATTEVTLYEIGTLLPELMYEWENLPLEKKLRVIRVLTRSFIVTRASTGFIKIEIVWKRTDWETDIVHLRIRSNGGTWTEEEDTLVETLYPTADAAEIIQALPTRTWTAIKNRSSELGVKRISNASNSIQPYVAYFNVSLQDALYAREHDLDVNDKNPQWRM